MAVLPMTASPYHSSKRRVQESPTTNLVNAEKYAYARYSLGAVIRLQSCVLV